MNFEQITSIVRQALLFGGGFLVSKGWVDDATLQSIIGALLALAASGWAIYTRRNTGLIKSAATVPEVKTIVASPELAATTSSVKIVSLMLKRLVFDFLDWLLARVGDTRASELRKETEEKSADAQKRMDDVRPVSRSDASQRLRDGSA